MGPLANVLAFRPRADYNAERYTNMTLEQRQAALKARTIDTLTELGRFYKSTGRWNVNIETDFHALAGQFVHLSDVIAQGEPDGTQEEGTSNEDDHRGDAG